MAFDWTSLIGPVIGGIAGAAAGGDTKTGATATRDPWAPAQPYMLDNLKREASLQQQLTDKPFNEQQTQGYNNLFGDIGNFRQNVMPGLMNFANKGMTSSYQRQAGGAPGSGGGYGGAVRPGGLMGGGTGPFSVQDATQGVSGGLMTDFNAQAMRPAPMAPAPQQGGGQPGAAQDGYSGGMEGGGGSDQQTGTPYGGIGTGQYTDQINTNAKAAFQKAIAAGVLPAIAMAAYTKATQTGAALDEVNTYNDPIAGLNALQGWTGVDPTYDYYGFNDRSGNGDSGFGSSSVGGNDSHNGDSSHGSRGW